VSTETLVPYDEALGRYEPVLGIETHIELGTHSKMFCGCSTVFGAPPNTQVCPVCLGLPGSLPVANRAAIEGIIKIGLALNCSIVEWCRFARKNYFYPDMPKNYQISQYDEPLCVDGHLDVEVGGQSYRVEIERVHMEEDTGKSLHVGGATGRIQGADHSLVDYNRAGIPLVEIVTKPIVATGDRAPLVARAYATELRELVRALDVSDVRMEEGSMRCDVNVSLMPLGSSTWGIRSETKNVNSLRSVERSVRHEIERQAGVLDAGERVIQETRHFHEDTGTTTSGRSKEEAQDYRYFPEPDLVPMAPSREWVEELRARPPRARTRRVGRQRQGVAGHRQRRGARPHRGDRPGRGRAAGRPQVVDERAVTAGHRARRRVGRAAGDSGRCRADQPAGRRGHHQRQARPAGLRRRARRRGQPGRGRRQARPQGRQRRG
jgi:aspartyl-tRNA(Asn)/glutamyl-tRNA(Gln) amidotransferase subunit B